MTTHDYTSTACFHGKHEKCPVVCKFCASTCRCPCHVATQPEPPPPAA